MSYQVSHIACIIEAEATIVRDLTIEHLHYDSRRVYSPATSLFFALKGPRRDGHLFIPELYKKGVRNFVVCRTVDENNYPGANFLYVKDCLNALQALAAHHRNQFSVPVIGITGSNGKTIVKEWLYQLLHEDHHIVRSPKSFNSQIGVPLSIWQMNKEHSLAIFEAGISRPGEMENLERMIRPTIGVLTNIGEAHSEGFDSNKQKEKEKRILFRNAKEPGLITIINAENSGSGTRINTESGHIDIPFTDEASIQNAVTCWRVMRELGYKDDVIADRMKKLAPVNMRLELKKGINNCILINDSYSADLDSLEIALNFLEKQGAASKKTVILSDFMQTSLPDQVLYANVREKLKKHGITRLIGIGERISKEFSNRDIKEEWQVELYENTDILLEEFLSSNYKEETILVKGARIFEFERIIQLLELKAHLTVLEINLASIVHNLKEYQQLLNPSTKVMAMVKAFAYGSGGAEIAGILQYHKTDYLGVAYADEGVELRKAGISLPVMVMNPEVNAFEKITSYNLEPELYSFEMMNAFDTFLKGEGLSNYPVHIEIETGMNRLGFSGEDTAKLTGQIKSSGSFHVQSVFTHLAASEEAVQDEFTREQFRKFQHVVAELKEQLGYPFLSHIANSAAVARYPEMQMDMVRLGIGLYGVDSSGTGNLKLQTVASLKTTIAQIKHLKTGDTVSYNRKSKVEKETVIATVRIGYADGYPRRLGNGVGQVSVKGKLVPVIGTVCMDMFMIDITGMRGVKEGDDVVIFGEHLPVQQLAERAGTIPYEIMTGISQRVKRVYFEE